MIAGNPTSSTSPSASSKVVGDAALRDGEADAPHRFGELAAIFGHRDRARVGADELNAVLLEYAVLVELHRDVERGLSAHRREQRVRPFLFDHELDVLRRDRLDVGAVGELGIGHDRRRIGVHENDLVALFLQRLGGLGSGVVELCALADDDRAGADEEDSMEVVTSRGMLNRHATVSKIIEQVRRRAITDLGRHKKGSTNALPSLVRHEQESTQPRHHAGRAGFFRRAGSGCTP